MAPNAPVAPVTIAVLPLTSKRESGFFKKSSDIALLAIYTNLDPLSGGPGMAREP